MNWDKDKAKLGVIPAIIFWTVSIVMFVYGLSFDDQTGWVFWIGVGISLANTVIQLIGNNQSREEMGVVLWVGWLCSYILGIVTNVYSLQMFLGIQNPVLEWVACITLGAMVEILPEPLLLNAMRGSHLFTRTAPTYRSPTMGRAEARPEPPTPDNYRPTNRPNFKGN